MPFRWNAWNLEHATSHGISPDEAELVVRNARAPYPHYRGGGKWLVWGRGHGGALVQVIYIVDDDDTMYIIHARPLTNREKGRYRRNRR